MQQMSSVQVDLADPAPAQASLSVGLSTKTKAMPTPTNTARVYLLTICHHFSPLVEVDNVCAPADKTRQSGSIIFFRGADPIRSEWTRACGPMLPDPALRIRGAIRVLLR